MFQSAPPHGGRLQNNDAPLFVSRFQSAPPHGGRHRSAEVRALQHVVSIRAPARGATADDNRYVTEMIVSIRAPARGATWEAGVNDVSHEFQSAPPHGGRPASLCSSHCSSSFNPRPRTGGDLAVIDEAGLLQAFQSAPPHGGRRGARHVCAIQSVSFNPRPRTGGDTLTVRMR